jgi:dCMP deaminase
MERPSWDQYYKNIVNLTAERSVCPRLQVGCLLIKDNRIISQGYNGYLSGCPHDPILKDGHNIGTIHAEQNAIVDCAKRGVSSNLCTAFITHYPCFNCFKLLNDPEVKNLSEKINFNIKKI